MSTLIDDVVTEYKDQYPELENFSTKHTIGEAHIDVSAFDSISFLSKDMMMKCILLWVIVLILKVQ